jgi:hypothetical protein
VHLTRVTEFVYRNRRSVTVVTRQTFLSAGNTGKHLVKDAAILHDAERSAVLRVPLPLAPTASSLRASGEMAGRAQHPPAAARERSVAVRATPPPSLPEFRAKISVIRANAGAPVPFSVALKIARSEHEPASSNPLTLPVANADGRMTLAPLRSEKSDLRAQPLKSAAGAAAGAPAPTPAPRGFERFGPAGMLPAPGGSAYPGERRAPGPPVPPDRPRPVEPVPSPTAAQAPHGRSET